MIGPVFRLLRIVLAQVLLGRHRFHGSLFLWKHRRHVHEGRRDEAAEFRLMRLEEKRWWPDIPALASTPALPGLRDLRSHDPRRPLSTQNQPHAP